MLPSQLDSFYRSTLIKQLVVLMILAIALAGAIPSYLTSQWPWQKVPEISQLKQLKDMQKNGLSLPGWQTLSQRTVEIGGHKWSAQEIVLATVDSQIDLQVDSQVDLQMDSQPVWLLLRPQTWARDLPQVDWMDINGVRQWTADSRKALEFTLPVADSQSQPNRTYSVKARFFRGWTQRRTDAVMQWYAWPDGGHPAPSHWFWADQLQQLRHRQHLPWVAVSIQIPIKPLGDIKTAEAEAKALAQLVQTTLMKSLRKNDTVGQVDSFISFAISKSVS
ncbi:cyanoexosortase B system-associated protein [Leptolyngbya sp. 7M]|uniref:cyanoexosortase B system-associated protein n=1 Tax=Leptolyngbya sp. 7M TaxID=2812896 RepID=UPI001B8C36F4|nr:cyanoexosortase B system-associated protein [Leptolyngbya sp. 7M]QYO68318.1 cyanoexosortase B system-associated protein [Leptolyngbya sp. 7M]